MLGGDEVYVCAVEAAAVVKVVLRRTGGLDSRRRCWSSRPHPTHAWLMRSLALAAYLPICICEVFSQSSPQFMSTQRSLQRNSTEDGPNKMHRNTMQHNVRLIAEFTKQTFIRSLQP